MNLIRLDDYYDANRIIVELKARGMRDVTIDRTTGLIAYREPTWLERVQDWWADR